MHNDGKVNNTTIRWLRKIDETNHFKVKICEGFDLAILKVKPIHYKRIEVFTIRFNPKSIATSSSNLLTRPCANSKSTDSFSSWIYSNTLVTLRLHSKVSDHFQLLIFVAATRFYQCLIVDLTPVDACVVRMYNTSQISQGVTHKSSKILQNVARVSLLYVDKLDWNSKHFRGLGPCLKILHNLIFSILDRLNLIFNQSSLADSDSSFL